MNVFFDTVGCRLNQAEIEQMAAEFRAAGHEIVEDASKADLVVVNTCAVTAEAASDSRQKVRQANHAGVKDIVLTGCWSTLSPAQAALLPGVSTVVPNSEKDLLAERIIRRDNPLYEKEPIERAPLPGLHRRTRAFIKVQDGCSNHCTFCVTRLARGIPHSESKEKILTQIEAAQDGHAQEVVLSGVHLGSWGSDLENGETITDLIEYLLKNSQIGRLRLSSIEPWGLDERFVALWENERMCRHLHLPLQAGADATLKRMARNTTPEEFRALVEMIRKTVPEMALTTDIIVGFPGESDEDFEESLNFVKEMNFAGGHVFRFSAREGTAAARLPGRINGKVAHARSERMRAAVAESEAEYRQRYLGQDVEVLWESQSFLSDKGWKIHGLTDNYLPVTAWSKEERWNKINRVHLTRIENGSLLGELLE